MNENQISISFTAEEKTKINQAIGVLADLLAPKLIALSPADKKRLSKISDDAIPFVGKVAQYVQTNPEFIPLFGNAEEFARDFSAFGDLREFNRSLAQITENLEDTRMLTGGEADDFARRYYGAVGQATKMNVPNAQAIYDDLSLRYEAQRANRPKKPPTA